MRAPWKRTRDLEPQAAYALWAETYPPWPHNELMRVEQRAMESMVRPLTASRALDLGTGTGRYLRVLAEAGVTELVGLDRSKAMLERALPLGAPIVCADATALPLKPSSFDLVLASLMVGDIRELTLWAAEVSRVLRPGGSLVYSDFHPSWRENRWERTFESSDGRSWRLPYHSHTLDDHRRALEAAALTVVEIAEPLLGDRAVAIVLRSWKE